MNYPRILRRMRQRIFDYPAVLEAKADRVLAAAKAQVLKQPNVAAPRGPFSGLTRAELTTSRTCETDWY